MKNKVFVFASIVVLFGSDILQAKTSKGRAPASHSIQNSEAQAEEQGSTPSFINECFTKYRQEYEWAELTTTQIACLKKAGDLSKILEPLCAKDGRDFSDSHKAYLKFKTEWNEARETSSIVTDDKKPAALRKMRTLEMDWQIEGYKTETEKSIEVLSSLFGRCDVNKTIGGCFKKYRLDNKWPELSDSQRECLGKDASFSKAMAFICLSTGTDYSYLYRKYNKLKKAYDEALEEVKKRTGAERNMADLERQSAEQNWMLLGNRTLVNGYLKDIEAARFRCVQ